MACNGPKSFAQATRSYFDYTDGAALLQIFHAIEVKRAQGPEYRI